MNNVSEFLQRTSEKLGFLRESYVDKNIPTLPSNITVIPFFGDIRSTFVLSSFLLRSYKENNDNYLILCSWNGMKDLFPYVDEYWSLKDQSSAKGLALFANNFYNTSDISTTITRNMFQHFENVKTYKELQEYYDNKFQDKYWQEFGSIKRSLPEVPSNSDKITGRIIVYPSIKIRSWQKGKNEYLQVPLDFWITLIERLIDEGFNPIIYQNQFTYDLSREFAEKCKYIVNEDVSQVLSGMRSVGCVLDVYSGISRMAIAARCPFVCVDERARYQNHNDYEIDDLCCDQIPKQYIFSFSSMLLNGSKEEWDINIINNIVARLNKFIPSLDRDQWMSTNASYEEVSYDNIRKRKANRMGVTFIKSNKQK